MDIKQYRLWIRQLHRESAEDAREFAQLSCLQTYFNSIETSDSVESAPPLLPDPVSPSVRLATLAEHPDAATNQTRLNHIQQCGQHWAIFENDDGLLLHAMRCKDRLCPRCQESRAAQVYAQTHEILKRMTAPKHLVLTLRSSDEPLRVQVDFMTKCWKALRKESFWPRKASWGYALIEVTRSLQTGRYHPHYHILINAPFIEWALIKAAWLRLTGTSHDVQISAVRYDRAAWLAAYVKKSTNVYNYDTDPWSCSNQLRGKRLIQKFGKFPRLPTIDLPRLTRLCSVRFAILRADAGDSFYRYLRDWVADNFPAALTPERPKPPGYVFSP